MSDPVILNSCDIAEEIHEGLSISGLSLPSWKSPVFLAGGFGSTKTWLSCVCVGFLEEILLDLMNWKCSVIWMMPASHSMHS